MSFVKNIKANYFVVSTESKKIRQANKRIASMQ